MFLRIAPINCRNHAHILKEDDLKFTQDLSCTHWIYRIIDLYITYNFNLCIGMIICNICDMIWFVAVSVYIYSCRSLWKTEKNDDKLMMFDCA